MGQFVRAARTDTRHRLTRLRCVRNRSYTQRCHLSPRSGEGEPTGLLERLPQDYGYGKSDQHGIARTADVPDFRESCGQVPGGSCGIVVFAHFTWLEMAETKSDHLRPMTGAE